jgi:hypothetical protein
VSSSVVVRDGGLRLAWARLRPDTRRALAPVLLTALSAIAFVVVRPGVNDLWAARARADASAHGVGLTYWFSWFSGGSAPGSYSVLSPYLSRLLTAEVVLAVAAVATVTVATVLLRPAPHALAATYLAAITTSVNVWQGRVPFVLGCAFAVGALLAARRSGWVVCSLLALGALLSSPVSGAFLGLALLGVWGTRFRTRHALLLPIATLLVGALTLLIVFGSPGPEPMTVGMTVGMCLLLLAFLLARPARPVRITVYLSLALVVAMALIPNGMGSNFARFVWFCLPVAVIALGRSRRQLLLTLGVVTVAIGSVGLVSDLRGAARPNASRSYYDSLSAELDRLPELDQYRLEVVDDGTHTASYALLDHATLARGFETQTDAAFNSALREHRHLPASVYRRWLDANAVGYVAADLHPPKPTAESRLILGRAPAYLQRVWSDDDWVVFAVQDPTPIVAAPARLIDIDQARLVVQIPCACQITIHTRWSPLLTATAETDTAPAASPAPELSGATSEPPILLAPDGDGWTRATTNRPGRYVLHGR